MFRCYVSLPASVGSMFRCYVSSPECNEGCLAAHETWPSQNGKDCQPRGYVNFWVRRCVLNREQPLNQSKHKSSNKKNCWVVIIVLCCTMYALKKKNRRCPSTNWLIEPDNFNQTKLLQTTNPFNICPLKESGSCSPYSKILWNFCPFQTSGNFEVKVYIGKAPITFFPTEKEGKNSLRR